MKCFGCGRKFEGRAAFDLHAIFGRCGSDKELRTIRMAARAGSHIWYVMRARVKALLAETA